MRDDSKAIFDDVLARWHLWARGYSPLAVVQVDPAFRGEISRSGWDSQDDINDAEINCKIMEAVDFQVSEMLDPHRTAIYFNARNCATGRSVWTSPRLPNDSIERGVIVMEARNQLMSRLISAGVL